MGQINSAEWRKKEFLGAKHRGRQRHAKFLALVRQSEPAHAPIVGRRRARKSLLIDVRIVVDRAEGAVLDRSNAECFQFLREQAL